MAQTLWTTFSSHVTGILCHKSWKNHFKCQVFVSLHCKRSSGIALTQETRIVWTCERDSFEESQVLVPFLLCGWIKLQIQYYRAKHQIADLAREGRLTSPFRLHAEIPLACLYFLCPLKRNMST